MAISSYKTERLEIYNQYIEQLIREGQAYYCFCSKEELERERRMFGRKSSKVQWTLQKLTSEQ